MTILETERLLMRRLAASDLDDLYALYRDPEIRRYFPEGTLTLEETREELEWFLHGHPDHPELGLWATLHKATGAFIGRCGLLPWRIDGVDEVEIAYLIAKPWQRQGLGTEAAGALLRYGFETLGLKRLIALIDAEHETSIRTAMAAGLKCEKEAEIEGRRSSVYAIERAAVPPSHFSIERLVENSSSLPIIARWLSEEWGCRQGYSYEDTLSWCHGLATREGEAIICAKLAEKPVGVALLVDCDLPSHPHLTPWLSSLFVLPECRFSGIGSFLTGRLCEIAAKLGHTKVHLYVLEGPLVPFYRRRGWMLIENVEIARSTFAVMRKTL
jgi:[ribosomal protein S5]-alanine N-acetyltransferase